MNGNNENPAVGGAPNLNSNQPLDQSVGQPTFQQAPQSVQSQPIVQPAFGVPNKNNQKPKKKTGIIIGCSIGAVILIAAVVVLLIMLLKHEGKTVTCTMSATVTGITADGETNIKVKDGEISGGDVTMKVDLKTMRDIYKDYEKDMVDEITERYRGRCEDHCVFSYGYVKGDNATYTMRYDKEGVDEIVWSRGTEGMSAQEIADEVQESLEDSGMTCTQH